MFSINKIFSFFPLTRIPTPVNLCDIVICNEKYLFDLRPKSRHRAPKSLEFK